MRKKQTAVSHSSTESEVLSSDARLRMDGIPASDLSDMVIEVLHYNHHSTERPVAMRSQCERHHKISTKSKHSMSEEISLKETITSILGCSTELTSTKTFKSNTWTPKAKSPFAIVQLDKNFSLSPQPLQQFN